tara:strand:+ start:3714 stop:4316 length:603 start_codon:yes stop_codon:yes gene_type:complete
MKKLILITVLLMSVLSYGQEVKKIDVYAGVDIANAIFGGQVLDNGERRNEQALALKIGATLTTNKIKWGAFVTEFAEIGYRSFGGKIGYTFTFQDIIGGETDLAIIPSIQGEWVWRDKEVQTIKYQGSASKNWGLALDFQFDEIFKESPFFFEIGLVMNYRSDKYNLWGRHVDKSGLFNALWENREAYFIIGYEIFNPKK